MTYVRPIARENDEQVFDTPWGPMGRKRIRRLLCEAQNWRCCYCGVEMIDPPSFVGKGRRSGRQGATEASIEHFIARANGGPDSWWNCIAACQGCNSDRKHMSAMEFFRDRSTIIAAKRAAAKLRRNRRKRAKWRAKKKGSALRVQRHFVGHDYTPKLGDVWPRSSPSQVTHPLATQPRA